VILTLIFNFLKETKKIQKERNETNFTFYELVEELKKVNMTVDHTRYVETHDISKIDLAVDAASFLVGLMQTYLGRYNPKKTETPVFQFNITSNNNYSYNNVITNSSNVSDLQNTNPHYGLKSVVQNGVDGF